MTEDHYITPDISPAVKPLSRWHSPDPMSTEDAVSELVGSYVRALQPDLVVETGTYFGHTAYQIGRALQRNHQGKLYTLEIDYNTSKVAEAGLVNLPVEVVCTDSLAWTPPGMIDFAWFDSAHDARVAEFERFLPYMHAGTVVGFHDCSPSNALGQLIAKLPLQLMYLPTPRGCAFGRVLV